MTKMISILFMAVILLTAGIAVSTNQIHDADAAKGSGNYVRQIGSNAVCGDKLCSEYPGGRAQYEQLKESSEDETDEKGTDSETTNTSDYEKFSTKSTLLEKQLEKIIEKFERGESLSVGEIQLVKKSIMEQISVSHAQEVYGSDTGESKGDPSIVQSAFGLLKSATITSSGSPARGHEGHQLAMILPLSDKVYVGKITFSASEPVQYLALHGPLDAKDDRGQMIWQPNEGTMFAMTFVDNGQKSGGWYFAGNALALHTMKSTPFTATYSLAYAELEPGVYPQGTVKTGTITATKDTGMGHEEHSMAMILPPRDIPYAGGVVAYSASENIQLVALIGPLQEHEIRGQSIWTPDGETKYAYTIVDGARMGVWNTFSGNALALHSYNTDGFTASYTVEGMH